MSSSLKEKLVESLGGKYASRLYSTHRLAVGWLERYRVPIVFVLVVVILAGGAVLHFKGRYGDELEIATLTPTPPPQIVVYVSGAVVSEGVYALLEGARLDDAIRAAGGLVTNADPSAVNLAARLYDEDHIHVPEIGEATPSEASQGGRIDINTAPTSLLETLPGIGPVKAQAIVEYRERHGDFERPEDLMKVSGIGPSTYEKVAPLIEVE